MTQLYNLYRRPEITLTLALTRVSVDVTGIIDLLRSGNGLCAHDFCLVGDDSKYAWTFAKEAVEDWHFKGRLYRQFREHYIERGYPEHWVWKLTHLELRAMLLQEVAIAYDTYVLSNSFARSDSYGTFGEYLTAEHDNNLNHVSVHDGRYYLDVDA